MPAADARGDFALPGGQPRPFERQPQVLFLVPQLGLGPVQVIDVERGADPVDDGAAGFSRHEGEAVVAPFAIRAREARLERERLLLFEAAREGVPGDWPILGMNMAKAVFIERAQAAEISA